MIKKIFKYFNWHLSGMKLRQRLLFSYLVFIFLPLGIFSILTYMKSSVIIENHIFYSAQKSFEQTFSYLGVKLDNVIKTSDITIADSTVNEIFSRHDRDYNIIENSEYISRVTQVLGNLQDSNDIYRVILYVPEGNSYSEPSYYFRNLQENVSKKWYKLLQANTSQIFWCPQSYFDDTDYLNSETKNGLLSAILKVKNPLNYQENVGLVRVDFKASLIADIIKRADVVKGSLTYIQNSLDVPVVVSDKSLYKNNIIPISTLKANQASDTSLLTTMVGDQKVFYISKHLDKTDWYLTTVIPYNEIFSETKAMRNEVFFLVLLIATAAFSFAWYVAFTMTKRIYILTKKMKDVQEGKLDAIISTADRDEIGDLTKNYNFMLEKIKQLIDERYKAGIELKNSELKILQAQINPHFLYNTLDMINWLAQKNQSSDVEKAIKALSMFYKLSLSNGREEISISDELEHVSFYVQIQNMRFLNKLHLIIEVEDEIKEYPILKLILQPIIENAIIHGIMKKTSKEGTILIEGKIDKGELCLSIQDDGIGMTDEQIERLISTNLEIKNGGGYGVKNVIERIKIFYGEEYGLSYQSIYTQGTTVEIKIPAKEMS